MRRAYLAIVMIVFACGGTRAKTRYEGQSCIFNPNDSSSDCIGVLRCVHADACGSSAGADCSGFCVQPCTVDGDCETNRCENTASPENGRFKFCTAPAY